MEEVDDTDVLEEVEVDDDVDVVGELDVLDNEIDEEDEEVEVDDEEVDDIEGFDEIMYLAHIVDELVDYDFAQR